MWVKICANTNLEDAKLAAELGADAVGFIFAPSKRQVTTAQVADIVPHLPAATEKIGVFTTPDAGEILGIVRATGLTGVQLHGGFDVTLAHRLRQQLGGGITVIQTLDWAVDAETSNADEVAVQLQIIAVEPAIDRVLVDSKTGGGSGGTGVSFNWRAAQETLAVAGIKLIVAGGLRPENVAAAVALLSPWGVDVASGVEAVPGRKDPEKLRRFLSIARSASSSTLAGHDEQASVPVVEL